MHGSTNMNAARELRKFVQVCDARTSFPVYHMYCNVLSLYAFMCELEKDK